MRLRTGVGKTAVFCLKIETTVEFESCIWDICFKTPGRVGYQVMDDHVMLVTGRQQTSAGLQLLYCTLMGRVERNRCSDIAVGGHIIRTVFRYEGC